jgi:hypothetical protein
MRILTLLGFLVLALWADSVEAQWYQAPSSGQVVFSLTEMWSVFKNSPPLYIGPATITIQFENGSQQVIPFTSSDPNLWITLLDANYEGESGTTTWTQTANIAPGSVFQIVARQAGAEVNLTKDVAGGQEGAWIGGLIRNVSTDALVYTTSSRSLASIPLPPSTPPVVNASANIHAVIISALADPARVIVSPNVTLTGGIVALGRKASPSAAQSAWSPGLKIIPDYALLTGEKIPPVTPNIIDVRIVRQEVSADFPSPSASPNN